MKKNGVKGTYVPIPRRGDGHRLGPFGASTQAHVRGRNTVTLSLSGTPLPPASTLVLGHEAGAAGTGATMGRPTCAVLPEAINSARTAASVRCIGNRVYTGADDIEAYFAIPGLQLGAVEEKRAVIVRANQEMEKFHRGRAAATPTA
jgi:hypothetical protein